MSGEYFMKKVLFLIHDLGQGGAEKVLVNLVNKMNINEFDITLLSIFDVGENKQFLRKEVKYKYIFKRVFRGNSYFMKLLTPKQLHNCFIKEHYDVEISFLEGPCARIISGCTDINTKLITWIHIEQKNVRRAIAPFRSYKEANGCYNRFDKIFCVSKGVKRDFTSIFDIKKEVKVMYNVIDTEYIKKMSKVQVSNTIFMHDTFKIIAVGKLLKSKGFDRILKIVRSLINEGIIIHLYILGSGPEEKTIKKYIKENNMEKYVDLIGYDINPYKYMSKCDLFVCASYAEGFSTAATEALVLGLPVCTVNVSGMDELLGKNNSFGVITENEDNALYQGIKLLIKNDALYRFYQEKANERGKCFDMNRTTSMVENELINL